MNHKTHVSNTKPRPARRPAESIVARLIEHRFDTTTGPVVIAVGGPGGTGKSTFSRRLADALGGAAILTLDDYKTDRARRAEAKLFGAHPEANRLELIDEHLRSVKAGTPFDKPVYDPVSGSVNHTEPFTPTRFTIIDGEISTYERFRPRVDFSVFIDADWKTQLATRITRDITDRGYTREKAIATFLQSNLREFEEFGADSKRWADIHLFCRDDYSLVIESVDDVLYHRFEALLSEDLAAVDLSGLVVALTTPFDRNDNVDQEKLVEHVQFLARANVRRLLVAGTTGEFFSLTDTERRGILALVREYFPGMVLFNAGAEGPGRTRELARAGEECGADALVVIAPYYYASCTTEGLIAYFREMAAMSDMPLVLYNFPRHTRNPLSAEVLRAVPHAALKDSAADLSLIAATPAYFVGNDRRIAEAHGRGARGFVTGVANALPEPYVALEKALHNADAARAATMQTTVAALAERFHGIDQIARIKRAVAEVVPGYPLRVRPPLSCGGDSRFTAKGT
jgi:4-hydroxy-tetrahydrodipicolinate synthase